MLFFNIRRGCPLFLLQGNRNKHPFMAGGRACRIGKNNQGKIGRFCPFVF